MVRKGEDLPSRLADPAKCPMSSGISARRQYAQHPVSVVSFRVSFVESYMVVSSRSYAGFLGLHCESLAPIYAGVSMQIRWTNTSVRKLETRQTGRQEEG